MLWSPDFLWLFLHASSLKWCKEIHLSPCSLLNCSSLQMTNGAFAKTSSCAYKSKRAGWQGFWREHFCRTWREDLCHFSVFTHQFVSCFFFPSHGKSAEFCSASWASLRHWLSTPGSVFTSLVVGSGLHWACITHCTTICAILTIDDLEKKGGVSMQILPLASHRYYGARQRQAVVVFPRGDSEL